MLTGSAPQILDLILRACDFFHGLSIVGSFPELCGGRGSGRQFFVKWRRRWDVRSEEAVMLGYCETGAARGSDRRGRLPEPRALENVVGQGVPSEHNGSFGAATHGELHETHCRNRALMHSWIERTR